MSYRLEDGVIRAGPQAREQFYDASGYGRPTEAGGIELAPVEAAYLLFRGDIDTVTDRHGTGLAFADLLASTTVSEVAFFVYTDLRERGFYLSPVDAISGVESTEQVTEDFVVYPRGKGPWDEEVAYRIRALSERVDVPAETLRALQTDHGDDEGGVLAVVDEESEVTYLELTKPALAGQSEHDIRTVTGRLLADRVLVPTPDGHLYEQAFYGQRLSPDGPVQLSLVEAAHLASEGLLTLSVVALDEASDPGTTNQSGVGGESMDGGNSTERIVHRGQAVEGERFDRRLRVYTALRHRGIVPKTGFKFGADFRTYNDVNSVDTLGHSELLVRVLPGNPSFEPRNLALDVRLAHGVRKRMVLALVDEEIDWVGVERLTP